MLFQWRNLTTRQRYIIQLKFKISITELNFLVVGVRDFLKAFDKKSKCLHIPLPKPETELGSIKSIDNLFAQYCEDIKNYEN